MVNISYTCISIYTKTVQVQNSTSSKLLKHYLICYLACTCNINIGQFLEDM